MPDTTHEVDLQIAAEANRLNDLDFRVSEQPGSFFSGQAPEALEWFSNQRAINSVVIYRELRRKAERGQIEDINVELAFETRQADLAKGRQLFARAALSLPSSAIPQPTIPVVTPEGTVPTILGPAFEALEKKRRRAAILQGIDPTLTFPELEPFPELVREDPVGGLGDFAPEVLPEDITLGDKALDFLTDVGGAVLDIGVGVLEAATGVDITDPASIGTGIAVGLGFAEAPDPTVLPGGGTIAPGTFAGGQEVIDVGNGGVGALGPRGLFRFNGGANWRPVQLVEGRHPRTGKTMYWQYAGRPLIFSKDLARCKTTEKVGRRFARRRPR